MYRAKIFLWIYFNVKSNGCLIFFSDRIVNRILKLVDLIKSMGFFYDKVHVLDKSSIID